MSRWPNKYIIGLTGNIAVGKSVVRKMLQHVGAYTIDADALAHQAMSPGAPAYKPIVQHFGKVILNSDGQINRQMLGNVVFSNPDALAELEAITHPIIRQAITTLITRSKQRVIVVEAIKLLDGELASMVDTVWVVDAQPETQLQRLMQKRKMPENVAKQRISSQSAQSAKIAKADVVIKNNGKVEDTWKQVQLHWDMIRQRLSGKAPAQAQPPAPAKPQPAAPTQPAPAKPMQPATPVRQQTTVPAQPAPAPAASPAPPGPVSMEGLEVRRGMPDNFKDIANFIQQVSGKATTRSDIMMASLEKSYLVLQNAGSQIVAVMGWTVENLVTRSNEYYMRGNADIPKVVNMMVEAVENASGELQSEAAFLFFDTATSDAIIQAFEQNGYEAVVPSDIKIPAWREAVQESMEDNTKVILMKKLREDRVLQPI